MSFKNQRPAELPEFATDPQYLTGPYPGSTTKVRPPTGTFTSGVFPEQQLPAEWENYIDNHYSLTWQWMKEMQLRNWFEVSSLANDISMTRINGATKNHYGDSVVITNDDNSGYLLIYGDMAPLVRPEEGGGNPTIRRFPDRYTTQGFPIEWSRNGITVDSTGRYIVALGTNASSANQCAMHYDFDKTVTKGRVGINTELALADYASAFNDSLAYDSSLDLFMIAGIDQTTTTDTHSWVSSDKGVTWGAKVNIGAGEISIVTNNRGRFVGVQRATENAAVYISDDSGVSWVSQGTITGFGSLAGIVWSESYRRFFAISGTLGTSASGVWESADGVVWEQIADLVNNSGSTTLVQESLSDNPTSVTVDGQTLTVFHTGRSTLGTDGVAAGGLISHDAGRTWADITMVVDHNLNVETPELGTLLDFHVVFDGSSYWAMQLRNNSQATPLANVYRTLALGNSDANRFSLAP